MKSSFIRSCFVRTLSSNVPEGQSRASRTNSFGPGAKSQEPLRRTLPSGVPTWNNTKFSFSISTVRTMRSADSVSMTILSRMCFLSIGSAVEMRCEGSAQGNSVVAATENAAGAKMAADAAAVRAVRRMRKCFAMACPKAVVKGGEENTLFTIVQEMALLKC